MHTQWKQGQVSCEEYRNTARVCREGVGRAKAWLELNLGFVGVIIKKGRKEDPGNY